MTAKKLHVVTITFKAYVYLGPDEIAYDLKSDIVDWEEPEVDTDPADGNPLGWDSDCLVYHAGKGDVYLRDALLPATTNPTA